MASFDYVGSSEEVRSWLLEAMEILEPLGAESPQETARRVKADAQEWRNLKSALGKFATTLEVYADATLGAKFRNLPEGPKLFRVGKQWAVGDAVKFWLFD